MALDPGWRENNQQLTDGLDIPQPVDVQELSTLLGLPDGAVLKSRHIGLKEME